MFFGGPWDGAFKNARWRAPSEQRLGGCAIFGKNHVKDHRFKRTTGELSALGGEGRGAECGVGGRQPSPAAFRDVFKVTTYDYGMSGRTATPNRNLQLLGVRFGPQILTDRSGASGCP